MENFLQELMEMVQKASPVIWNAAQNQVRADTVRTAIWLVLWLAALIIVSVLFSKLEEKPETKRQWNEEDRGYDDIEPSLDPKKIYVEEAETLIWLQIFLIVSGVAVFVFMMIQVSVLLNLIMAPDFATIKVLLDLMP